MSSVLTCPQGAFTLDIIPSTTNKSLRAWDAADEYILHHLAEQSLTNTSNVVIVNDNFGALTNALIETKPTHITDSWIARQAAISNLSRNNRNHHHVTWLNSLEVPSETISLLLMKVPKSHALLEDQLIRLRSRITENSRVIAAGMTRSIHNSTLKLFEEILGPTRTSLAQKKARLILPEVNSQLITPQSPWPCCYELPGMDLTLSSHANVFSATKPDIGSLFMLDSISVSDKKLTIVDLACGNGTLGIVAAKRHPQAKLVFTDESWMAVNSAKNNFLQNLGNNRHAEFYVGDCLNEVPAESADMILNNPPFHQQNVITDEIAWKMFNQSHSTLKKGGRLFVVGNRHLNYHNKLKRVFSNTKLLKSSRKFVILMSVKH